MSRGLHWFRNDLRLRDNTALLALADQVEEWLPVFVLDPRLLGPPVARRAGPRACFLLDCVTRLSKSLAERGVPLLVRSGLPEEVLPQLLHQTGATKLSFNRATTPFAQQRDAAVTRCVEKQGVQVLSRVDHVVFAADDIRKATGEAGYAVYTPYRNRWWERWQQASKPPQRTGRLPRPIAGFESDPVPSVPAVERTEDECRIPTGGELAAARRLEGFLDGPAGRYHEDRDRPDIDGTSRLSPHLRFGTISVRDCLDRGGFAAEAESGLRMGVRKWLDELVWREFYAAILEQHPRVLRGNYRREYDALEWNDDADGFAAWCEGRTGFPIVDAGMRQLRATGWMHNRVRMIVASFLTKDLLIDWREGERFFFEWLVDGDPASNNGGWQWAASTGTDAQPYFRIFNPTAQGKRWDPEGRYVKRWIPELRSVPDSQVHDPAGPLAAGNYPMPIVDHAERRALALERFQRARALADRT